MRLRLKQLIAIFFGVCVPLSGGAVSYTVLELGTLGGTWSYGSAINQNGWITGEAALPGNTSGRAYVWNGTSMQNIGTLGESSAGTAINANGWVTGYSYLTSDSYHAFMWNGSVMQDLGTLGGAYSQGLGINSNGFVTGVSWLPGNVDYHAFRWNGSAMQDLGTLGGTYSHGAAINDSGWVAGYAAVASNAYRAFISNGGAMQDLGTFGGNYSLATAINSSGMVTGWAYFPGDSTYHAFVWNGSTMQDLGTLGGQNSQGLAINSGGLVVGVSTLLASSHTHAFISNGSTMHDLGTLGGSYSYPYAINASGLVVGTSYTVAGVLHAFVWDGNSMTNLNTFMPAGSPFVLSEAFKINDAGQIVANGYDQATFEGRAFLLSPTLQFNFTGFFDPVANPPGTNVLKAGQAVPVKFSLGGNKGLDIFASGYPLSQRVTCGSLGSPDDVEQTVAAGASGLKYDAAKDQYTYVWKTVSTWGNTCRTLIFKFADGSQHVANFQFKK